MSSVFIMVFIIVSSQSVECLIANLNRLPFRSHHLAVGKKRIPVLERGLVWKYKV